MSSQAATSSTATIAVSVWRGDARQGSFQRFQVPQQPSQTILDVVTWIQRHADTSLSYRFACRVGMCGSCAMMVNGIPRWTCRTHVNKVLRDNQLTIEPLRNMIFRQVEPGQGPVRGIDQARPAGRGVVAQLAATTGRRCGDRVY